MLCAEARVCRAADHFRITVLSVFLDLTRTLFELQTTFTPLQSSGFCNGVLLFLFFPAITIFFSMAWRLSDSIFIQEDGCFNISEQNSKVCLHISMPQIGITLAVIGTGIKALTQVRHCIYIIFFGLETGGRKCFSVVFETSTRFTDEMMILRNQLAVVYQKKFRDLYPCWRRVDFTVFTAIWYYIGSMLNLPHGNMN
jgi:hypothetical protein